MSDDGGDKKFDLSQKKREELHAKGDVPRSHDVTTAVVLITGSLGLLLGGASLVGELKEVMRNSFLKIADSHYVCTLQNIEDLFGLQVGWWVATFGIMISIGVYASQFIQVGFLFSEDAIGLKMDRINPLEGLKRMFSLDRLIVALQGIMKMGIILAFSWFGFEDLSRNAVFARPINLQELEMVYGEAAWLLAGRITLALAFLAALDYGYHFWKFNEDHKMSEQEMKDERRSNEASPELSRKRRMMARKLSSRRMVENVKDATIVITNPTHYAVAMRYVKGETPAPIVVAKGVNRTAIRMKERAFDLRIAVREDRPLAKGLYKNSSIGNPIPPIFYKAVATILASLYRQGFLAADKRKEKNDDSVTEENE